MDKLNTAYIALGSNIGDRASFLKFGLKSLEDDVKISIISYSSIYETSPVGYVEQADFLNMVVEIKTSYDPLHLLDCTQEIQKEAGRNTEIRWGPRTLDLDILLYNKENIEMEHLIIPHPRMHERSFVIVPLKEINPSLYFPAMEKSIEQVYEELSDKEGVRIWKRRFGEDE